MLDRFGRIMRQRHEQPGTPQPTTPQTLMPGDAMILQDGRDFLVRVALDCEEQLEDHTARWRWILLDDGSLLEVRRQAMDLYGPPDLLYQGTPSFIQLTGGSTQHGLLKVYEARVREGTAATLPVLYEHADLQYRIHETGTFRATWNGMTDAEVWSDVSQNAGDNVYFRLKAVDGREGLGIWTSHIALFSGAPLTRVDIKGLYSR